MHTPRRFLATCCYTLSTLAAVGQTSGKGLLSAQCLETHVQVGQEFSDYFSRTIALQVPGFDAYVRRVSGSGDYKVLAVSPQEVTLDGRFLYDGSPAYTSGNVIKDRGRTVCWNKDCAPATDASGLTFNPVLWGAPAAMLHAGQTWRVNIPVPWELGPPGTQVVTVVSLDPPNNQVTLERQGEGDGAFADDIRTLTLTKGAGHSKASVAGGHAKWSGLTSFQRGIVFSDALLTERPVTVTIEDGSRYEGVEREYILLNAVPSSHPRKATTDSAQD